VRWNRTATLGLVMSAAVLSASGIAAAATERGAVRVPVPARPQDNYTPTGPLVADSGFRPPTDGFTFANYGCNANTSDRTCIPPETDLTPTDVRTIFGDGVCGTAPLATCTLSTQAQNWLKQTNADLSNPNGGHCFGISVTSLELWKQLITADQFGATSTSTIRLLGNQAIQREIASTFVTQLRGLNVQRALIHGTPKAILRQLIDVLKPNATDTFTLRFFNGKQGNLSEGHAVTPYAVEDRGGGNFAVLIYDNNFPGVTRAMMFDTNSDTWSYQFDPSLVWLGGASDPYSLDLAPTSASLGRQPCPFCRGPVGARSTGK
jgi:hypothetical protein